MRDAHRKKPENILRTGNQKTETPTFGDEVQVTNKADPSPDKQSSEKAAKISANIKLPKPRSPVQKPPSQAKRDAVKSPEYEIAGKKSSPR